MIILDFDGTIVDLWPRYHAVFCTLSGGNIDLPTYKAIKQKLKRDEELFRYLNLQMPSNYFVAKKQLLEDKDFLKYDQLIVEREKLIAFFQNNKAMILTSRRYPTNFMWELDYLQLSELRTESVCIDKPKTDWVKSNIKEQSYIIGDDVRDLQVASVPNISAIMVLSGLGTTADFAKAEIAHQRVDSLQDFLNQY